MPGLILPTRGFFVPDALKIPFKPKSPAIIRPRRKLWAAAPAFGAAASSVSGASDDTVSLGYPSGISAGDLLVAFVMADAGGAQTVTSFNTPGAWAQITNQGAGARRGSMALWSRATGSESGTLTFSVISSLTIAILNGVMVRYTGVLGSGTPVELAGTTSGSNTTPGPNSMTTTVNDELLVCCIGAFNQSATCTAISGATNATWTESFAEVHPTASTTIDFQQATITTSGTATSGGTATLGFSAIWQTIGFGIKPVVAAAYVPYDKQHSPGFQAMMAN